MAFVVAEPCIGAKDRACVEVCPGECFYEGEDQLYIHPEECIDCAACEAVCPVTAIFAADSVPDQWKPYIQKNIDFFKVSPDYPKALTKAMRGNQDNFAGVFIVEGRTIKLPPPPSGYPTPVVKAKADAKMEAPKAETPKVEAPKAEPKVEAPKAKAPKPEPKVEAPTPAAKPEPAKPAIDLKGYEEAKGVILDLVEMLAGARELDLAFMAEAEKFAQELKAQVAKEFGKEVFTASELERKDPIFRQKHDLANAILERVKAVDLLAQYHLKRRSLYESTAGGLLTGAVALTCQIFAFWVAIESASITIPSPTIWDYLMAALTPEGLIPFLGFSTLAGLMGLFPLYAAYKIFVIFRELKVLRQGPLTEARIDPKSRLHIAPYQAI